jgi:hypothetical protein
VGCLNCWVATSRLCRAPYRDVNIGGCVVTLVLSRRPAASLRLRLIWRQDQCLEMLADQYQLVTLTEGRVVCVLTYLKVVIQHVVVDDAGR